MEGGGEEGQSIGSGGNASEKKENNMDDGIVSEIKA